MIGLLRPMREKMQCQRSRGSQTRKQTRIHRTLACARNSDGKIADERDRRDQHHHPPYGVGIQRLPGTIALVRQNGQQHHRDQQQPDARAQLLGLQCTYPAVQHRLDSQQQCRHHGEGRSRHRFAQYRHGAERKRQKRGDHAGNTGIVEAAVSDDICRGHDPRQRQECKTQQQRIELLGHQRRGAPEQPDQTVGAYARDPRALFRLALLPATLDTHQQPDRQGNAKVVIDFKFGAEVHYLKLCRRSDGVKS